MPRGKMRANYFSALLSMSLVGGLTAWVLFAGTAKQDLAKLQSGSSLSDASAPTVLPETSGPMCPVIPVSAEMSLMAALGGQQRANAATPADASDTRPTDAVRDAAAKRPPIHVMRDPNPAYSAVAVDLAHDEVVMADENNFSILTYSRTENTPPAAKMSEPKRMIAGPQAYLEFNCAVYVDPANGDIYSVNNDTLNWLTVFNRDVKGDQPPTRKLRAPHTVFGIAVDEERQEMLLADQDDHSVVVFKKASKDEESPVRVIQGSKTHLADPHGIALDPKAKLIFVTNWGTTNVRPDPGSPGLKPVSFGGVTRTLWPVIRDNAVPGSGKIFPPSIAVFPKDADGNVEPIRVIEGPKAQLNWPTAITVDAEHGEMFVANDTSDSITVYKTDASGDAAPIRVIKGPKSLVKNPTGVTYDAKHEELWVTNFGNHTATVYKRTASGDEAPIRVIRSAPLNDPAPMMGNPHTIDYDSNRQQILVSNCVAHPQIAAFDRMAEGGAKAVRSIAGQSTLITRTIHGMAYDPIHDEIVVPQFFAFAVLTYKGDANGDVAPIRKIFGPHTRIKLDDRIAIDAVHEEIFIPEGDHILVFNRMDNGDVAPKRVIEGPDTHVNASAGATDPVHNLLIVSGGGGGEEGGGEGGGGGTRIQIFDRMANGNTPPLRVIRGKGVTGASQMTVIPSRGYILATVRRGGRMGSEGFIGVWSINDDGDVPPRWLIGGPNGQLRDVRGITTDMKNKNVIVSDKYVNGILTYNFPEIF